MLHFRSVAGVALAASVCGIALAQSDVSPLTDLIKPSDRISEWLGDIPIIEGSLETQFSRVADDDATRGGNPETVHVLVSFAEPPGTQVMEEAKDAGITILGKVTKGVWSAVLDRENVGSISDSRLIRDVQVFPVAAKISPLFAERVNGEPVSLGEGDEVSVTFFEDVSEDEARQALESVGLDAEGESDQAFSISRTLPVALPGEGLIQIALLDDVQMIEPLEPPLTSFNQARSQVLSNVDDVQQPPFDLSGDGVTMGIWEIDSVRGTHQELTPRVTVVDTGIQGWHANHVAGTMVSSGINSPGTEGMAPAANLRSWTAASDFTEMVTAAGSGADPRIRVSNHSYGANIGWDPSTGTWQGGQAFFGSYTTGQSATLDRVIAGNATGSVPATELVSVWAAGNDRNDAPTAGVSGGPQDCLQGGVTDPTGAAFAADCIGPRGVAKNIITVGAMNGAGAIAPFSSYGPTDDGRIKPDLVAQGVGVLSLGNRGASQTDTGTTTSQGTSMASPVVAGIAGLMNEEFNTRGLSPLAATYKAILIQTARDVAGVGQSLPGPDFATGWGIADAEAAIELIRRRGGPGYAEGTLASTGASGAWNFPFVVQSGSPDLRVSLAWSDPPGAAGGGLVNDLDMRLIPPGGGAGSQPFAPNAAQPWLVAARGDNTVDNVEQVLVANPVSGTWTVRVTAKPGSLVSASQRFAIAGPITPDAGPVTGPKSDIIMVLDESGSMSRPSATPGVTKNQSLQRASTAMVDYLELVGGHSLSIVAFDETVSATNPPVGLDLLDVSHADAARQAIDNLNPGGGTNIIAGVNEAAIRLASEAASHAQSALVLFSDGRHNFPRSSDVSAIDEIMDDATRFFSVGYGSDVDSAVMPGVAANHDGVHLEEQGLAAGQLAKLFMVVGGLAADEQIIVDPDYRIEPGRVAVQDVIAGSEDKSLTFTVFWDTPGRAMDFLVVGPERNCKVSTKDHEGYSGREGEGHQIIRIMLPYRCQGGPVDGKLMHSGQWSLQMRNRDDNAARVKVMALADSTTELDTTIDVRGREAILTAQLSTNGRPIAKGLKIRAEIAPNRPSTGDSLEQDKAGTEGGNPAVGPDTGTITIGGWGGGVVAGAADANGDIRPTADIDREQMRRDLFIRGRELDIPRDILDNLLRDVVTIPVRPRPGRNDKPVVVELRDDGKGADKQARDGYYTARVRASEPVLHNVRFLSEQARRDGVYTRESLASFAVR